ncbi:threonine-phosphate decarboxylase CobD [Planomicrobium sp. YIM 101495]|uniref:threonine-phosphate decarboxylase CobD n=1 Tax=Planomicrobium sp. YIM 101495 TaxID=2665160 RepID=UPI0012B9589A|nr:threonine-phosphate decarboxylase CobD [Planomicrobium sp. YIM 101495]MTD30878.1 threonine-phosphate decarboxylase [Planomicrobium sp. YIM 101495]
MNLPDHGANPNRLYERLGMAVPKRIIDFSENVHPLGPPSFVDSGWDALKDLINRYPDAEAEPFRSAAASYHGFSKEWAAAGNGAAEIFTWLARRYRNKRVLLIEPAFSEYRKTLEAEGVEIRAVQLMADTDWKLDVVEVCAALQGCSALYICNPHNPTGRLLTVEEMTTLAKACGGADCELVIDEAFIDFAGEEFSFSPHLPDFLHVILVRSMTKMYAIAGLRLGYVLAEPKLLDELTAAAAHWNVNALAAEIGTNCFKEEAYRQEVQRSAKVEREEMTAFLRSHGCIVTDSAVNFLVFRLPGDCDAEKFFTDMLQTGIVLRHTRNFAGMDGEWFRVGMKTPEGMAELRGAINAWLEAN